MPVPEPFFEVFVAEEIDPRVREAVEDTGAVALFLGFVCVCMCMCVRWGERGRRRQGTAAGTDLMDYTYIHTHTLTTTFQNAKNPSSRITFLKAGSKPLAYWGRESTCMALLT